jgi:hypothetical protein
MVFRERRESMDVPTVVLDILDLVNQRRDISIGRVEGSG